MTIIPSERSVYLEDFANISFSLLRLRKPRKQNQNTDRWNGASGIACDF